MINHAHAENLLTALLRTANAGMIAEPGATHAELRRAVACLQRLLRLKDPAEMLEAAKGMFAGHVGPAQVERLVDLLLERQAGMRTAKKHIAARRAARGAKP